MKKHSLERMVELARKTGSKLIVHNEFFDNEDVVILSVDEYEKLVMDENDFEMFRPDVREMSEGELLNQINRDIATWRANKEQEEEWEKEMVLDDEADEMPPFDPFVEQDYHPAEWHEEPPKIKIEEKPKQPSSWHSISDVIEDRFSPPDEIKIEDISNLSEPFGSATLGLSSGRRQGEPFGVTQGEPKTVPFKPVGVDTVWQEEPLASDEPIFYEEPV